MDTRSKKWRAAVSFTAFFLGISLLLTSVPEALSLLTGGSWKRTSVADAFQEDYQNTRAFRDAVASYLEDFLTMAVGGNANYSEYSVSYNGEITSAVMEAAEVADAIGEYGSGGYHGWDDGYDFSVTISPPSSYGSSAQAAHDYFKEDKNVLYDIRYDGEQKYTNAEGTGLDGPNLKLPEGYNFLLWFDGSKVRVVKDGKELDIYGDGYYREGKDWYVPGYKNFTVDEEAARASVVIAAAKSPMLYVRGSYGNSSAERQNNRLYWLEQNLKERRDRYTGMAASCAAGVLLLAVWFLLRGDKRRADAAIARVTGRVWYEGKLLLLLAALAVFLAGPQDALREITYMVREEYLDPWIFTYYAQELSRNGFSLLVIFWSAYLLINDWRHNPKPWKHSLTGKFCAAARASDLKLPLQRRMVRRFGAVLIAAAAFAASALALYAGFRVYNRDSLFAFLLLAGLLALLLWMLYRFARGNRETARDIGALVGQIAAVHAGGLTMPLDLPEDADLAAAAKDLNDIQRGMNEALEERMRSERMKVELIANVSHDIKTPLTSIISYVELLGQEEDLPEHVKDYIRILESKSQRLKTMVQDVFEVSKAASGQLPVTLEILDLGKLLRQTLADMAEQIDRSAVTVRAEIPEEPVMITADGQRLYRVFQNLVQNALQYSLDGSRVHVSLAADGTTAVASVKNTSREEIARNKDFTERFVRGDDARTDGGSGLGLSIARTFTEACGGRFSVETIADLFVVTVEFARQAAEEQAEQAGD